METFLDSIAAGGAWALRNSLEASVLILLVGGLAIFWRERLSSRLRAAIWILVGIRLVLPFAPASALSIFNLAPAAAEPEVVAVAPQSSGIRQNSEVLAFEPAPAASTFEQNAGILANPATATPREIPWIAILASIWLIGALAVFGRAIFNQIRARRAVFRLPDSTEPRLAKILRRCARHAGVPRQLRIVEGPENCGIAVFGFLCPSRLIVPRGFADRYTETEIRGIFLHELAHVRRGDLLWNWVTLGIQALHWFNPLVWWAGRQFLTERELLCDRFVLRQLEQSDRTEYGFALLKTLQFSSPTPAPSPALVPFFSRKSELKHRLTMIKKSQSISPIVHALVALLVAAACAMTYTSAIADDREGDRPREGARDGDRENREREGDRPRGGDREDREREGDRPRDGDREGGEREGARDGDRERPRGIIRREEAPVVRDGQLKVTVTREGVVIGDRVVPLVNLRRTVEESRAESAVIVADPQTPFQTVATVMNALKDSGIRDVSVATRGAGEGREMRRDGEREGDRPREGARDGEGERRFVPRDGEGERPREGARDGEGERPREGARDGEGERSREGARDGEGERRFGPRDGEGDRPREGARDGDMPRREGVRDGEGDRPREGARDGEGDRPREGARDGEGDRPREGARDGEGDRPREGARDGEGASRESGARDGESRGAAMDDRQLAQLTRIFGAYDKNGDRAVTFEEWVAMKNYQLTDAQRERERGWFDQADANDDNKMTLGEWIDWKSSQDR